MFLRRFSYPGIMLLAVLAAACSHKEEAEQGVGESVPVELAFALSGGGQTKTTAVTEVIGGEAGFRGMTDIRMLPFSSAELIEPEDVPDGPLRSLPSISATIDDAALVGNVYHNGILRNNHAHVFPDAYASLPKGTSSVLLYGSAPAPTVEATVQETKHKYGSLIETGLTINELCTLSDVGFKPDPIFTGEIPEEASMLANIMTRVASAVSYTQTYYYYRNGMWHEGRVAVSWDENLAEASLAQYYTWFTGAGELITGAGLSVEYLLSTLYGRLKRYNSDDEEPVMHAAGGLDYPTVLTEGGDDVCTYAHLYNGLCRAILDRFDDLTNDEYIIEQANNTVRFNPVLNLKEYPTSAGLPSGAAVLRWNGTRFIVVSEGLDGIAAMENFCYMPPLYYFVNTTISTTSDINAMRWYTSDVPTWEGIISSYRQGKSVSRSTRSVALDKPLQFAVAQLAATVKATSSLLPDADGDPTTNCSVSGKNFPITGVLIGRQHEQTFDFEPVTTSEEYYLYDNQFSGVYLTTTESAPFRSLVLPVPAGEDVFLFLELRNDSNATFTGAEGLILPGNYFYLAGKLEHSEDPDFPQVFMGDHVTTARFVISSLENAHVAVPEMGNATLVMGVQTTINWIMAASSYVVLD